MFLCAYGPVKLSCNSNGMGSKTGVQLSLYCFQTNPITLKTQREKRKLIKKQRFDVFLFLFCRLSGYHLGVEAESAKRTVAKYQLPEISEHAFSEDMNAGRSSLTFSLDKHYFPSELWRCISLEAVPPAAIEIPKPKSPKRKPAAERLAELQRMEEMKVKQEDLVSPRPGYRKRSATLDSTVTHNTNVSEDLGDDDDYAKDYYASEGEEDNNADDVAATTF